MSWHTLKLFKKESDSGHCWQSYRTNRNSITFWPLNEGISMLSG